MNPTGTMQIKDEGGHSCISCVIILLGSLGGHTYDDIPVLNMFCFEILSNLKYKELGLVVYTLQYTQLKLSKLILGNFFPYFGVFRLSRPVGTKLALY